MKWTSPKDAPDGIVMLGWINGTQLPSYKLVSKTRRGTWEFEGMDQKIPESWIAAVAHLPSPPKDSN